MARRYELSVQLGLFGDVAVVRHWGRIGTAGQTKEFWFPTDMTAQTELHRKSAPSKAKARVRAPYTGIWGYARLSSPAVRVCARSSARWAISSRKNSTIATATHLSRGTISMSFDR
jgi:predicted DNA-binding WGR domain protein